MIAFALLALVQSTLKFNVAELNGAKVSESQLLGKTTVLFVFCSCDECRLVAEQWSKKGVADQTWVCYSGDREEVRDLAKAWPGTPTNTRFLVDPKLSIAKSLLALPCPAAFVFGGGLHEHVVVDRRSGAY